MVDLSADFRFPDVSLYEKWYQAHTAPELNAEAVYGLPELHREEVRRARLVGNPGCYPTGVILGLAPLAQAGLLAPDSVIADCKSGASGAGRQALLGISFCEVNDGFRAYKVVEHRHTPEMEQELSLLAGTPVNVTFTPHLVPMSRGILGTLYANLTEPRTEADLRELYGKFYQGHPFVRLHPPGSLPDTRDVRGANFCDLALRVAPGRPAGHCHLGHRQPHQGRGRPGGAELQPDGRFPGNHGAGDAAFHSVAFSHQQSAFSW